VSSAVPRLIALASACLLLALGAFWFTRQSVDLAPGQYGLTLGMTWLKREYQLDDATFAQVTDAHRRYFRACAERCHELDDLNRHFLSELQSDATPKSDIDAVHLLQEKLCHDCRLAMIAHVHEVAALMPADSGRRFIADVQSVLDPSNPRKHRRTR
jgi:hypothetical protein